MNEILSHISDEQLAEALDEAHAAQERLAAGVGDESDEEFVGTITDPVLSAIFGIPTLEQVEDEARARGLVTSF